MSDTLDASPTFLEQLIAAGHLIPMGVDGLYGKSGVFEDILDKLDRLITRYGADQKAEVMRFPPAISQQTFEESEYLKTFPHFAGTVHCFCGDESEHRRILECVAEGKDWTEGQKASGVVLTPAACYPSYPVVARRGPVGADGVTLDEGDGDLGDVLPPGERCLRCADEDVDLLGVVVHFDGLGRLGFLAAQFVVMAAGGGQHQITRLQGRAGVGGF
jgi:hypothetical protein